MVDPTIVKSVRNYIHSLRKRGVEVRFVVVFGSHTTGRSHELSDIDVVVVSPQYDAGVRFEDAAVLWETAAKTDSRIEPVPCGEKQWAEDDSSALLEIARTEGETVAAETLS
jgi:predicted nucleotidyltransferase